ncbi:nucleotidyltransferase domain-containing protein [Mahella australiensis]|uniref:DNA polymerase beta domain protein region n=1 Tax=Mahella australiensis (strain DSM 15567 / CIP 107919 / 50-1 BON) TaxID=697281 RepID=F3ZWW7_MAHA5|nr:nucleotidyltransferase domain-containing protein [Mahella australiensis]AEE97589.1 DNA polymerase beta domain protein region [Mahella australiensis 50-1 BON]
MLHGTEQVIKKTSLSPELINDIIYNIKAVLGEKLESIVLYGSYARASQESDSDIDIIALVDGDDSYIKSVDDLITDITVDLSLKYNIVVSIFLQNLDQYRQFLDVLPFSMNIEKEGIELYERENH